MPNLQFSDIFDIQKSATLYAHDKRARLTDILPETDAIEIHRCLTQDIEYSLALVSQNRNFSIPYSEWTALASEQKQQIISDSHKDASTGQGFIYDRHVKETDRKQIKTFEAVETWLNSQPILEWARAISGHSDIIATSAQATRYLPGQYLTRHKDTHPIEQRRMAYVLSFTPEWHPDWGGLLQFYQDDGTPREAWTPGFNTMSIFDVKHVHSVTYVAPFAPAPRLSITGWFRATPL
ncbi:MAG: 2OG-Fe(II) oxygenase family protein [Maricaulaceae bacterium]